MNPEQQAELARRLASLQRWTAVMNYMLMYPDADIHYAHNFGALEVEDAFKHCAERLVLHSKVIRNLITETV